MHKKIAPIFEETAEKFEEQKENFAAECFEENKDNAGEFAECMKQKQEALHEISDKLDAYKRFGLLKSSLCMADWDDSRECIKEARSKLKEAVGGLFATEEE